MYQPAGDSGLQVRARLTPPGTVALGSVGYTASLCAPLSLWTCEDFTLLKKKVWKHKLRITDTFRLIVVFIFAC